MSTDYMHHYEPYRWAIDRLVQEFGDDHVALREETDYGNKLAVAVYRSDDRSSDRIIVWLRNGRGEDVNRVLPAQQRQWLDRQVTEVRTMFGLTAHQ